MNELKLKSQSISFKLFLYIYKIIKKHEKAKIQVSEV
jgi:hypothetical protein